MSSTDRTDVLVAGAGPTGMLLAAELARRGVRVRLIEQLPAPAEYSRALGVMPRTMEMMAQLGMADAFVTHGHKAKGVLLYGKDRRELVRTELTDLQTDFPFFLLLPQTRSEAILADHIREMEVEIERGTSLLEFEDRGSHVRTVLGKSGGQKEELEVSYLVGCDGSHSVVRQGMKLEFEGDAYHQNWLLADVFLEPLLDPKWLHLFTTPAGPILFFPLPENVWRIVAMRKGEVAGGEKVTLEDLSGMLEMNQLGHLRPRDPLWVAGFGIQHRRVGNLRIGRVFLCGDSAHIHSPAGGQGMNTGLGDAFNLGWKLANVVKGRAKEELLNSYEIERIPVIDGVLKMTDRMTHVMTATEGPIAWFREWMMPLLAKMGFAEKVAFRLSQLQVAYPHSPAVLPGRGESGVKPGERMPPLVFRHHQTGQTMKTSDLLARGKLVLLVMPDMGIGPEGLRKAIGARGDLIDWHWVLGKGKDKPSEARSEEAVWV
ncbi:MAG: FAD-dependent monooxygenase, partial [Verrucomicrobia bacterium]|nr:FAD-dependent monooxygenase [Verrucomicrobiota bacterium]